MTGADTSLGGRDFPSTCWSRFLGGFSTAAGKEAVESLAASYWKPIYAYIRTRWSKSNEDAKDLAQDFFLWMMESDFLARADRGRGRFRVFVKVALEHYLTDEARRRQAQKRGGDRGIFAIDGSPSAEIGIAEAAGRMPDQILDDAWRAELFVRATQRLHEEFRAEGKDVVSGVFRDYYLSPSGDLNYREMAAKHGISEVDVSNHLMLAKRRFRAILTDLVAETVENEEDLQDELRTLFGGDA
jgi:RNA polymerase sigma factor (sigma-70 family)